MCSGRDVQFSAILLSCVAVLCHGAGAFGTEDAVGLSAPTACDIWPLMPCLPDQFCAVHAPAFPPARNLSLLGDQDAPCATMSAMALPDGPGAVCLGLVGFVCVSLIKSRKTWIGLCLCLVGQSRLGMMSLAGVTMAGPHDAGPDVRGEDGAEQALAL